ncbi:MAG: ATP phosphoribosyltransferase [Phycisphaerales bacterium]
MTSIETDQTVATASASGPNRTDANAATLRLALPKGRMQEGVFTLLRDAGMAVRNSSRGYRPTIALPNLDTKLLKPQNIIEMLFIGSRDLGFCGADWVAELEVDLVELVDTGLDPVRLVAAAPAELLDERNELPDQPLTVASEYERLTKRWIRERGLDARFVRSYGATEVFPPEDADCIVDNTATGATLRANGLHIVDELMRSSTRLYANPEAYDDPRKRDSIDRFALLVRSVLEARRRVTIEVNVTKERLDAVIEILPCMREPTISPLRGDSGYAVKVAALRDELARVIPLIRERGGTDIVVSTPAQIVP